MQKITRIHMPDFVVGRGALTFIKSLGKKKIGIIRGGKSYTSDVEQTIEQSVKALEGEYCILAQISGEPCAQDIFKHMEKVRQFQPDMILAIGGGSVLDTAKAIHLFYENPTLTFEEALIPYSLPPLGKKAIHVAAPTTSGTGSEATSVAVFIDEASKTKKLMLDPGLIPHYAIIDANLTDTLSDALFISTSMDALTHAIEASVATNASEMIKSIALEAAVDIIENLTSALAPKSHKQKAAREKIHVAAALAGVAITNACTGIVHSYDHPGAMYQIGHGQICTLMLPYAIKICDEQKEYATLAKRLGYQGTTQELTRHLIQHIFALKQELQLPLTFQELGIEREDYFSHVQTWATQSLDAFATRVSPANMTKEKGVMFYRMCYEGIDN